MAETSIEWTSKVWNPTIGCDRVSPGCDHCYALTMAKRLKGMGSAKYQTDGDPRTSGPGFGLATHEDALTLPLRWRKPERIFVNSMSDLFHDKIPDSFIARVFAVMAASPGHTYQLLTKRHGRMRSLLRGEQFRLNMGREIVGLVGHLIDGRQWPWPLPNVWLGVSVENQQWADIRIPALLDTPAAVRWLSCEPLLGPVDLYAHDDGLHHWLPDFGEQYDDGSGEPVCQAHGMSRCWQGCAFIDWVVVGGESGPGARALHPDWALSLRDQCTGAGVPFFFKQWGAYVPPNHMPESTFMSWDVDNGTGAYDGDQPWRVGKKRAGRELDGRTWDEYPVAVGRG